MVGVTEQRKKYCFRCGQSQITHSVKESSHDFFKPPTTLNSPTTICPMTSISTQDPVSDIKCNFMSIFMIFFVSISKRGKCFFVYIAHLCTSACMFRDENKAPALSLKLSSYIVTLMIIMGILFSLAVLQLQKVWRGDEMSRATACCISVIILL